jgi:uncharacterized protein YbcI
VSTQPEHRHEIARVGLADGAPSKQLEISNAVVRIYKRYMGRGPRSARTHLTDEFAMVLLSGCLTRAERSLYEAGQRELLMSQRHAMQQMMAGEMIESVQSIVGRQVISFMSTNDPEKELGVELFMLETGRSVPVVAAHEVA